jgi:Flp pilus assembly protein TadD
MGKKREKEKIKNNRKKLPDSGNLFFESGTTYKTGFFNFIKRYDWILLFLLFFVVYNSFTVIKMSGDTTPAQVLPFSILNDHSLFFDSFTDIFKNPENAYAFVKVHGHYVSLFPIVTPILITPIYVIPNLLIILTGIPLNYDTISLVARTSAAFITALAGMVVYLISKEIFSKRIALLTAFIFAFATGTWSISSQALWQHGMSELLLLLMIYIVVLQEKHQSVKNIVILGIVSGLLLFNRPPDALLIIPILLYVIIHYKKNLPYYIIPGFLGGLPFLWYNVTFFGNPFGGYKENIGLFAINLEAIPHFIGLIFAPNAGILIFSPILIIAVFGYWYLFKMERDQVHTVLIWFGPVIVVTILMYSFFWGWFTSSYCYGQRYLTSLVPVLALFGGIFLNKIEKMEHRDSVRKIVWIVIIVVVGLSFSIQFIGVLFYPFIKDASMDGSRVWFWNDTLILRSLNEGTSKIDSITIQSIPPLPPLFVLLINPSTYYNREGVIRLDRSRPEEAIPFFDKVLAIKPDYAEAYFNKGVALNNLRKFEDAISQFDRALALNPNYTEAYGMKGVALNNLRQFEDAIPQFDRAVSLDPKYGEAYCNKGISLNNLGRYDEAVAVSDQALTINKYYAVCWKNKGNSFIYQKKYDEALVFYDAVLDLNPKDIDAWYGKGVIFGIDGKYREALDAFNQVLIIDPNDKIAYQNKENLLNILRNISENHQIE